MEENTLDNFLLNQKLAEGEILLWKDQFKKQETTVEKEQSPYLIFLGLLIGLILLLVAAPLPPNLARFLSPFFLFVLAVLVVKILSFALKGKEKIKASAGGKLAYLITDQRILVLQNGLQGELSYENIYDVSICELEGGKQVLVIADLNASKGQELRTLTLDFPKIPGSVSDIVEAGIELVLEELPDINEVMHIIDEQWKEKGPLCNVPSTFQEIAKKYDLKAEVGIPSTETVLKIQGTIGNLPCMMELLGLEELYMEIGISDQKPFSISPKRTKSDVPFKKKYRFTSSKSVKEHLLQPDIQTKLEKLHELKGGSFKLVDIRKATKKKVKNNERILDLEMIRNASEDENNTWLAYTCDHLGAIQDYEKLAEMISLSFDTTLKLAQILDVMEEEERL